MGPLFPSLTAQNRDPALAVGGQTWSYAEVLAHATTYLRALEAQGVVPGDRVAVWTQRHPLTPIALVGNVIGGLVTVPLNADLGSRELEHVLADAAPKVVVAADPSGLTDRAANAMAIPSQGGAPQPSPSSVETDTPLLVLYTSGTTGPPKGARITAGNIASNLDALARAWQLDAADRIVHALPLFHVHGLVLGLFGALRAGACLEWLPKFDGAALMTALRGPRRVLYAVPTMYHRIAELAERDTDAAGLLTKARLLVSGSAGLPLREHQRIAKATGRAVIERYGLTETLINCAVRHNAPDPGYVGRAVDGSEVLLVDDARRPMTEHDDSTIGEVAVRGPNVFAGYLNRPEATAAVMEGGMFFTGDLATRKADGSLRIVGRRATDLIKTGGFKVGAGEIEAALLEYPGVREAAVAGIDDPDLGEKIVAWIVPSNPATPPAAPDLEAHVARILAPHKRPRDIRFLEELPRNAMGKVMKAALRGPGSPKRG